MPGASFGSPGPLNAPLYHYASPSPNRCSIIHKPCHGPQILEDEDYSPVSPFSRKSTIVIVIPPLEVGHRGADST